MATGRSTDIDAYIAGFPPKTRALLRQIRTTIRKAAPKAEETISYSIPAFRLNGRMLVYFAGYKGHVGVYPLPKGGATLLKAMAPYKAGKGTLRFHLDEKLPVALIAKVTAALAKANAERASTGS